MKRSCATVSIEEELEILDEFLGHGRAIRKERQRAAASGEEPDFQPLIDRWGGVTLFYRKGIDQAPAYRQNHEEIVKALEEGIGLAEGMNPLVAIADEYGHLRAMRFEKLAKSGEQLDRRRRQSRRAVAQPVRRRRDVAEHDLRAGAPGHVQDGRQVLPALRAALDRSRDRALRPCTTRAGPRSADRRR